MQNIQAIPVHEANEVDRATFIRQTYMHLAIAVLGFILVEMILFQTGLAEGIAVLLFGGRWNFLIALGIFMFISHKADDWARNSDSQQMQYIALALYTIGEAIIFVPLLFIAANMVGGTEIISQAATMTLFLFLGLTIVVFTTRKDFSFLRNILTVGFSLALGAIVLAIIFGFQLGIFFSFIMVALAAGSILYQTSNLMYHYNTQQYVAAALGLFASLMLLFWYILRIFMSRD